MVSCACVWLLLGGTVIGVSSQVDFVYHNFDALKDFLNSIKTKYPDITHLYSIGKSAGNPPGPDGKGRDLLVLALAAKKPSEHVLCRPEIKYVGNIHGNEVVSREVLIHLINYLVTSFGKEERVTKLLTVSRVHILVSMNPDGFERAITDGKEGLCDISQNDIVIGRNNKNIKEFDLNRNFPDYFTENKAPIQKETQAVIDWIKKTQFTLSANLHGGSLVANYPWDSYKNAKPNVRLYSKCPDDDIFIHLSKTYAQAHLDMKKETVCKDTDPESFPMGITNGANWYPITGGIQDYTYVHGSCLEVTLEISCCKYPKAEKLKGFWDVNKEPLVKYLEQIEYTGVRGIVVDCNNKPVAGAHMYVDDRKDPGFKTTELGEYWRILVPGKYTLTVVAKGLPRKTVKFKTKNKYVVRNIRLCNKIPQPVPSKPPPPKPGFFW